MSQIKQCHIARRKLEEAIAALLAKATAFGDGAPEWKVRELLAAGREYGRAMNRLERVRR